MTPEAAHAEAVRRVRGAAATAAAVLDLGDLPLAALPAEVAALTDLRVLAIGSMKPVPTAGGIAWEPVPERPTSPLADLSALAGLTGLTALSLVVCPRLADLTPLAGLTGLADLSLGGCTGLADVGPLAALPNLARLSLSHTRVTDLAPLAALPRLADLDLNSCMRLADLAPLARMPALTRLNLNLCGQVADLTPVAGLAGLMSLGVAWTAATDLAPLAGLTSLTRLNLGGLGAGPGRLPAFAPIRPLLPRLTRLVLFCADFADLPQAVCGEHDNDNVIDAVRAYYADLDTGAVADAEAKLFVLGNGGVGKTQLARRLRGEPFDPAVPSTHGVQLAALDLDVPGRPGPVRVNLWDFGGQDVYHGSHALFVDRHAVFVVLWHPDLEAGAYEEAGVPMRHRPLAYWLDYIRGAADPATPVLVVQARCDDRADRRDPPAADLSGLAARTLEASARTDRGLGRLREEVREAVGDLLRAHPPPCHRPGVGGRPGSATGDASR